MSIDRGDIEKYAHSAGEFLREMYPDAVSIVWKGSSYKPWDGPFDFIDGLSDIDLHVYRPGGLEHPWTLRRNLFDDVGSPPGHTPLQLLIVDIDALPAPWTLLPGTFEVLSGSAPDVPPATDEEMRSRDRDDIAQMSDQAASIRTKIIDLPDAELWGHLRTVRWMFPTVLSRVAVVAGHPPRVVWTLNRTSVLELTKHDRSVAPVRMAAIGYFEAAVAAAANPGSGGAAERALRCGHDLLMEASDWLHRTEC